MSDFNPNVHNLDETRQALQRIKQDITVINYYILDGNGGDPPPPPPPQPVPRYVRYWTYALRYTMDFTPDTPDPYVVDFHRVAVLPQNYTHLDLWITSFEGPTLGCGEWLIRPTVRWKGWIKQPDPYNPHEPPEYPEWDHDEFNSNNIDRAHPLHRWTDNDISDGLNIITPGAGDYAGYPINGYDTDSVFLTAIFRRPYPDIACYKAWLVGRYVSNIGPGQFGELCGED